MKKLPNVAKQISTRREYIFRKDFREIFLTSNNAIDIKSNSKKMYRSVLNRFFNYLDQAGIDLKHITQSDIIFFRDKLQTEGKKATTVQNYITVLKIFFDFLSYRGLYPNIAHKIKTPKSSVAFKKKDLSITESRALLDSIDPSTPVAKRDLAMIALMLVCGLRTIEVSRANVGSIERDADGVFLHVQGKGRNDDSDIIVIPPDVAKIIDSYLATRENYIESDPLFVSTSNNSKGKRLSTVTISTVAKNALTKIGLVGSQYTAHSLRHSAASNAIREGIPIEEVSKLLRHKSINTTMIYNHAIESRHNRASGKVAEAIFHGENSARHENHSLTR